MNSFFALAWPAYWISSINAGHAWIWFIVAYAGYWSGSNLATRHYKTRNQS